MKAVHGAKHTRRGGGIPRCGENSEGNCVGKQGGAVTGDGFHASGLIK